MRTEREFKKGTTIKGFIPQVGTFSGVVEEMGFNSGQMIYQIRQSNDVSITVYERHIWGLA